MDDQIRHIFVLMLENRSFDHLLGAMPGVDGNAAAGPRFNYERPGSSTQYPQHAGPIANLNRDPGHAYDSVMRQIDGDGLGSMGGFVYDYVLKHRRRRALWNQVMSFYDWGSLKHLHKLAGEFCVSDRWFSSVPGPTWTNRFFAHSGTSQGWVEMPHPPIDWNLHRYSQTTVYDRLSEAGVEWRIYYGDIPQSILLRHQWKSGHRARYRRMKYFGKDLKSATDATFPAYVFIEPRYFLPGANDQHPPHHIEAGDDLIAAVYNALRANEELWESSLLIITYDEHGGFYDHVEPPHALPPDGDVKEECRFDRLGVRVPTVLVSKWIKPGVFRPAAGKLLDHTSILRYATDRFGLGPLGDRTADAASIGEAISSTPLTSTPTRLSTRYSFTARSVPGEADPEYQLNDNQRGLIDFAESLEVELQETAGRVGRRTLRAAQSLPDRIEVAKERVERFLDVQSVAASASDDGSSETHKGS